MSLWGIAVSYDLIIFIS